MRTQIHAYRSSRIAALVGLTSLVLAGSSLEAQQQLVVPEGTVITARSETALSSETARVGDRFITTVTNPLAMDGIMVIPTGSRIEGSVTLVRAATSRESGVVGVDFTRLVLPNGNTFGIRGKLTSTDPAEREQIEAQGGSRVVFVGGRRGVGAAVGSIGAGSPNDPVSGFLGALGTLLSEGADVNVPVNTPIAVQLESAVAMTVAGLPRQPTDAGTIYTSAEMVRQAQEALRARNYYRGPVDGRLTNATRRALFEFQVDNEMLGTGNLDSETAQELGLSTAGAAAGLSPAVASTMRRNSQTISGSWRDMIAITASGRMDPRRTYQPAELELYFALSAFADNASLYDQMVRASAGAAGIAAANQALIGAARRVDAAMQRVNVPSRIVSAWRMVQTDLRTLDARYPM